MHYTNLSSACTDSNRPSQDSIKLHHMIGDGLQSKVYLASQDFSNSMNKNSESNDKKVESIAVKVIEKEEFKYLGLREFKVLKEIEGHPNIIKAFSHFSGESFVSSSSPTSSPKKGDINSKNCDYIALEYCPNGDLFDMIKKTGKLSSNLSKHFLL